MVSAEKWRKKRFNTFKAPSGDEYSIERPDPLTLIQFWIKECGIEKPLDSKDLGDKILKDPKIIAQMLIQYVKEPKIAWKRTDGALSVEELMKDQTDSLAILREIMNPFIERTDALLEFFRAFEPRSSSRRT